MWRYENELAQVQDCLDEPIGAALRYCFLALREFPHYRPVKHESPLHWCLEGLAVLARYHGKALVWALVDHNHPSYVIAARALTGVQIALDFVRELPERRACRATVLELDWHEKDLLQQSALIHARSNRRSRRPEGDQAAQSDYGQTLFDLTARRRDRVMAILETIPGSAADLAAWRDPQRDARWAEQARMISLFNYVDGPASWFTHTSGYAMHLGVLTFFHDQAGPETEVADHCANFVAAAVDAFLAAFPERLTSAVQEAREAYTAIVGASREFLVHNF